MRFLVATDGSAHADRAVALAARWAGATRDADVCVVHAVHVPALAYGAASELAALEDSLDEAGRATLARAAASFEAAQVHVTTRLLRGDPAAEIAAAANEANADVIVLGCRGRGQLHGLLLGSVSERVLHTASRPVLIVR